MPEVVCTCHIPSEETRYVLVERNVTLSQFVEFLRESLNFETFHVMMKNGEKLETTEQLKQLYQSDFEVIIVNNGTQPESEVDEGESGDASSKEDSPKENIQSSFVVGDTIQNILLRLGVAVEDGERPMHIIKKLPGPLKPLVFQNMFTMMHDSEECERIVTLLANRFNVPKDHLLEEVQQCFDVMKQKKSSMKHGRAGIRGRIFRGKAMPHPHPHPHPRPHAMFNPGYPGHPFLAKHPRFESPGKKNEVNCLHRPHNHPSQSTSVNGSHPVRPLSNHHGRPHRMNFRAHRPHHPGHPKHANGITHIGHPSHVKGPNQPHHNNPHRINPTRVIRSHVRPRPYHTTDLLHRECLQKNTSLNNVRHNAICDNCESRINGIRYKCLNCEDYDLCETCEEMNGKQYFHAKGHVFAKIYNPNSKFLFRHPHANRRQHKIVRIQKLEESLSQLQEQVKQLTTE